MSSFTREQLESWIGNIEVSNGSNVLDIGGSQNPIQKRLKNKGENTTYKILDLEQPHECKIEPDIICDLNEMWRINGVNVYDWEEKFDTAFCLEVMEYIWNPIQALQNINNFLKKDGWLVISFPFIYPHHNPKGLDYLRYTRWGCIKLLKETGFKIEEITPRVARGDLMATYQIEGMRPSKDYRGHNEVGYLIKCKKV